MNLSVKCGFPATVCGVVCKFSFCFFNRMNQNNNKYRKWQIEQTDYSLQSKKKEEKKSICQYVKAGLSHFIKALKMLPL